MRKTAIVISMLILTTRLCWAATYYINANTGSDNASGSEAAPFATIQKAAGQMQAGDVCCIRGGMYRETVIPSQSGNAGYPIRFEGSEGENVFITGLDIVTPSAWEHYQGNIYKAHLPSNRISQVFVDEQPMKIARFPNHNSDNLFLPHWGTADNAAAAQKPALSQISDSVLGQTDSDFTDAGLWLLTGAQWVSFSTAVASHTGSTIEFIFPGDADGWAYKPQLGSHYFLYGSLSCLTTEKEWFWDKNTQTLYFYPPAGTNPAELNVQIRTRQLGFNGNGQHHIEFRNITFWASEIDLSESESCLIENARVFYPVPFYASNAWGATESPLNADYTGIKLGGRNNMVRNTEVAYSWGEGIVVGGENNLIENCLVHDTGWLCTDAAPIHTQGAGHCILKNTIYNAGRSGIVHRKSKSLEIAYNDIYDCGLLTTDLGATYCWQTDGDGTVIHHNWVHDIVTTGHTAGIYLDNGSSNFVVHHNVVWNTDDIGIQTNLNAYHHKIYNNTVWNCAKAMGGGGGDNVIEGQIVYNNLSNAAGWFGNDVQQNLIHNTPLFLNAENGDFRLLADSPARDDYVITAPFLNPGFESGTGGWSGAGSQLESISDPIHSGNLAVRSYNRSQYWEGVRQTITEILKEHGPGRYTIEAWVKLAGGQTKGYLRFKLVDDSGEDYPGMQLMCNASDWTKLSYSRDIRWEGDLTEAVFELMTTPADAELVDLYIDDCSIITPPALPNVKPVGGIFVAGIHGDVTDGKVDAGAYEYGGTHANWTAGSTLQPALPDHPTLVNQSAQMPLTALLLPNYPNPFNGYTTIQYRLPQSGHVKLTIYNILGQSIRILTHKHQQKGLFNVHWDGLNDAGQTAASGIYCYRLEFQSNRQIQSISKKLILMQ